MYGKGTHSNGRATTACVVTRYLSHYLFHSAAYIMYIFQNYTYFLLSLTQSRVLLRQTLFQRAGVRWWAGPSSIWGHIDLYDMRKSDEISPSWIREAAEKRCRLWNAYIPYLPLLYHRLPFSFFMESNAPIIRPSIYAYVHCGKVASRGQCAWYYSLTFRPEEHPLPYHFIFYILYYIYNIYSTRIKYTVYDVYVLACRCYCWKYIFTRIDWDDATDAAIQCGCGACIRWPIVRMWPDRLCRFDGWLRVRRLAATQAKNIEHEHVDEDNHTLCALPFDLEFVRSIFQRHIMHVQVSVLAKKKYICGWFPSVPPVLQCFLHSDEKFIKIVWKA